MTALEWFKSSYSSNDGPDCVEVAIAPTTPTIHVRDSKDRHGARLTFTGVSWTEFVAFTAER
ncbi:DUF397 domain-containing protein [Streptomyces olivochromogenes]|uniref:DUF397 domain-containing protein n=1 Tax=Streptomyces olivochromogenes TaxID=1963 RepID=UPI001F179F98|nr:DUF397 domain-containing protein [Streptomyces olivochromogenes]MCF3131041.1 DUF397 domain-containing protein [Streptomyces olivochromogenes]